MLLHHTHKHGTSQTAALQQCDYDDDDKYHFYAVMDTSICPSITAKFGLQITFTALPLLIGYQEGIWPMKNLILVQLCTNDPFWGCGLTWIKSGKGQIQSVISGRSTAQ